MKNLVNKIPLVSGATRGAGRGIACALGEAGATVYCMGRSSNKQPGNRPETIEETAELVTRLGGKEFLFGWIIKLNTKSKRLFLGLRKNLEGLIFL